MNVRTILRHTPLLIGLLTLLLASAGCATNKVDWTARVGTYTFDQAVLELGPPTKQAKLTDGTTVAEWMTQRGRTDAYYPPILWLPVSLLRSGVQLPRGHNFAGCLSPTDLQSRGQTGRLEESQPVSGRRTS